MSAVRTQLPRSKSRLLGSTYSPTFIGAENISQADAMRPGVICTNVRSAGSAPLDGKQEAIVIARASIFAVVQYPDELSFLRIFRENLRRSLVLPVVEHVVPSFGRHKHLMCTLRLPAIPERDSIVACLRRPHMNRRASHVTRRGDPVRTTCLLDTKVP